MAYSKDLVRKAAAERNLVDIPLEPMKPRLIRMHDRTWNALRAHFRAQGLTVSAGIRQVLHAWMGEEGIR